MAPIHHHFEMLGWQENKVVVRFWIARPPSLRPDSSSTTSSSTRRRGEPLSTVVYGLGESGIAATRTLLRAVSTSGR